MMFGCATQFLLPVKHSHNLLRRISWQEPQLFPLGELQCLIGDRVTLGSEYRWGIQLRPSQVPRVAFSLRP